MIKQPMLANNTIPDLYTEVKYPCYIQPKFDGIRCIGINGVAYSRKMKPIPNKHIQQWFSDNNVHGLDGELMVVGDFNNVQSAVMSEDGTPDFYYMAYDYWDSDKEYIDRLKLVRHNLLCNDYGAVVFAANTLVVSDAEEAIKLTANFVNEGMEGAMLRSFDGKYKQGRSTMKEGYLLKVKTFLDDEAVVIGFEEKMTNTNTKETDERGYSKRSSKKDGMIPANTLGSLQVDWNGVIFNIGSGFNDEQRKEIWDNQDKYLGKLVTFKYQELSSYGVPRFPVFKWVRLELGE